MYLRTRLLLGIAAVTLAALLLSVLVPLGWVRPDVDRETDGTLQLTTLLLRVQDSVHAAPNPGAALAGAAAAVRQSQPLRHVRITLQDAAGNAVAATALEAVGLPACSARAAAGPNAVTHCPGRAAISARCGSVAIPARRSAKSKSAWSQT
jgi:hypothetical protein